MTTVKEAEAGGMALLRCANPRCLALFAVGASQCPQCAHRSAALVGSPEEKELMAKISTHGGATDATDATDATQALQEATDESPAVTDGLPAASEPHPGTQAPQEAPVTSETVPVAAQTPQKPSRTAPKAAWVNYARAMNPELSVESAEQLLKSQLIDQYD